MNQKTYSVVLEREQDGAYHAFCPALPGCHTMGETREYAIENMRDAIKLYLGELEGECEAIPEETVGEGEDRAITPYPPQVTAQDIVRVAVRTGFLVENESGRHVALCRDSDRRMVVFPTPATGAINPKALLGIVKDLGLEPEQFTELL